MSLDVISNLAANYFYLSLILIFIVGVSVDFCAAKWTKCVSQNRAFAASNWSLIWLVLAMFFTIAIVEKSIPHIACYIAGSYVGTYIGVKISKKEDE